MKGEAQAHAYYEHYLKMFEKILGNKATTTEQLNRTAVKVFGNKYAGTFARDLVDETTLNSKTPYAIINNETSQEDGEHWVCVAYHRGKLYAYDSYGNDILTLVPELKMYKHIENSDRDAEQVGTEANCGARCLAFLNVFDKHGKNMAMKI